MKIPDYNKKIKHPTYLKMQEEIKRLKEEYVMLQNASDKVEEEKDREIERIQDLCNKYEEEHKTTFEEWKKAINIINEFDKWLLGEKMLFYRSSDDERLIRYGETKNKWLELKGSDKE